MKRDRYSKSAADDVRALRDQLPYYKPPADTHYLLQIIDGKNIAASGTQYGVKRSSTTITELDAAYDPSVGSTEDSSSYTAGNFTATMDGVGRAILYRNGVADTDLVLVLLDPRVAFPQGGLATTQAIISYGTVAIPVAAGAGGGELDLWVPGV